MALDRKINFLLGKNDVGVKSQLFPRKKLLCVCVCARCELVLPIRFQCHHYCDSIPLSVSTIQ